ncbi:LysM peptidoglycan-binding domain-containing protein [Streptomyces fuscichromogenes]|uniref:Peptidoglycan-binding protein LysM n=1 Tax=Streptomyces fuscichromogenes TaxID=1324013 RepID=A0A918CW14_9ACTN|nr:transglycosylase family protein [Streptomyces fuscichromogenes]GGN37605.1 peptidoglycan-binding protein LysM [Streptomyces fuscichromogenes]
MLSGNGRHRRPRQAPALLVAAGVTGSAIAIPLLGAVSAHAADGSTWDQVAECESGGSWSADNGTGYYGGLQMSLDDWSKYGGLDYAGTPDQASRSQQIAVAEKILADQGTKPWRTCALLAGLSSDDASVNVDTGLGDSGDSSGSADSSDSSSGLSDSSSSSSDSDSGSASDSGSDSATPSPSATDDSKTDTPSKSTKTDKSESSGSDSGSGASKASESPVVPKADDSDNSGQTEGSWSLVDTGAVSGGGKHRGGSANENETKSQGATASGRHASPDSGTYTVRVGDTLASIADSLDLDGGWRALYAANKADIGADPNDITAGQTLKLGS